MVRVWWARRGSALGLAALTLLGLVLRIAAWRWHEFRPLGGDEREYLDLALHLARGQGYYDLQFMRPPLFPAALAAVAWLADGDLQGIRFANILVSTLTIPLMFWWTRALLGRDRGPAIPLLAAGLAAGSYTLALNATELLTEAATLAGLTLTMIAVLRAGQPGRGWRWAALAGALVALVCLIRSVALPLLALGAWWLAWHSPDGRRAGGRRALAFVLAALLTIAPWTVRNALSYGGFILIDTTGPENLWLDNDPGGREAVKAQLYAMGDDRVGRSKLASQRGLAALAGNPGWVAAKSWGEFRKFWALEQTDDMLARPAIWVRPAEVWLRLLLGDGLWLATLIAGGAGLLAMPLPRGLRPLLGLWALYTVFTGALFHVEYRYRLPLYLALLPCAAWALARLGRPRPLLARWRSPRGLAALGLGLGLLALTFAWRFYPAEAARLGRKHWALWQAERSLAQADLAGVPLAQMQAGLPLYAAQAHAAAALRDDPESVLARVLLARIELGGGRIDRAQAQLQAAIDRLPAHPYAHLVRGDLLRSQGDPAARRELAYESASGEDLQAWSRERLGLTPLSTTLDLGGGLDLGFIGGFYAAEQDGTRWMPDAATIILAPPAADSALVLRVAAQRPPGAARPLLGVAVNGVAGPAVEVPDDWTELRFPLPRDLGPIESLAITLTSSATFVPHAADPANPDGRDLGLRLDWARLEPLGP
ncbi:MAG TPA: glycosyltransferase family 39 protein [Herpetosiphonaceae bacterium]|nr:glycosyltransferase family 39 protein [Herpetosiphonaceae bacterium]